MDSKNITISNEPILESLEIFYQGANAKNEAKLLHDFIFDQLHIKVNIPENIPDHIGKLGASEVIIKIILSSIVKGAWNIILDSFQKYFKNRKKSPISNIQIIIKLDPKDLGRGFPFQVENKNWEEYFYAIKKYIDVVNKKSLVEMIEERIKIDDEICKLFGTEATFLDIDVFNSLEHKERESLIESAYSFEQYFNYVEEKVEKNGGNILGAKGDDIISWFRAPDDAIKCALDIFIDRDKFNMERSKIMNTFNFRIGINTGFALLDNKNGKVFSKGILELAGYLREECVPGTFLISENTYKKLKIKEGFEPRYTGRNNILSYIFSAL